MCLKRQIGVVALLIASATIALIGCSEIKLDEPRQVVIALFGAMEKNDEATLTHLLDLPELMRAKQEDYALQTDRARVFTTPEDILKDLTGDGETKKVWFSLQRIVSNAQIMGETATVDVTFVDKEESHGYRTTFGLHRIHGEWRIYSFKTYRE